MLLEDLLFGATLIKILQELFTPQFTPAFEAITLLGSSEFLVGIAAVVYWCFDKRKGRLLTYILLLGAYVNFFLKLLIPSPRPPLELRLAEKNETSFGFPSGHVQDSITLWTSMWLSFRKRSLAIIGTVLIFAVGVSRLYLGLHNTAQVIGGVVVGLAFVGVVFLILRHIPRQDGKIRLVPHLLFSASTVLPLVVAVLIFGVVGDGGRVAGYLLGFSIGAIFEDRYVSFSMNVTNKQRLIRIIIAGVVGGIVFGVLSDTIQGTSLLPVFLDSMLRGLTIVLIIPAVFKKIESMWLRP